MDLLGLADDDRGELHGGGGRRRDRIQHERVGRLLDAIERVVERCGKPFDILPIEWRNERRRDPFPDIAPDRVTTVLRVTDLGRSRLDVVDERSMVSSSRAAPRTFAASSTKRSKKRSSRGINRSFIRA